MAMSTTRKVVLTISGLVLGLHSDRLHRHGDSGLGVSRRAAVDQRQQRARAESLRSAPDYFPRTRSIACSELHPSHSAACSRNFAKRRPTSASRQSFSMSMRRKPAGPRLKKFAARSQDFRASGKPVYAYMETGFNKDLLTSRPRATRFTFPPSGELFVTGLAADVMFFPSARSTSSASTRCLSDWKVQERGRHVHAETNDRCASRIHQLAARRSLRRTG
jgi:hypothetical protein